MRRLAVIDIGTVTCRLLVADVSDGRCAELCRRCAITNLGEGVDASGILLPQAIARVRDTIAHYQDIIETYKVDGHVPEVCALATSASRDASNAADLIDALDHLGVKLQVIPGSQEAALSFAGASAAFPEQHLMVADIGGGSTELIFGEGAGAIERAHSFDIGCRRVTERYLSDDPPTADQLARAREWVRNQIAPYIGEAVQAHDLQRVVAVAGTATSVVSVDRAMEVYDASAVDGTVVGVDVLTRVCDMLAAMPLSQRMQVVGLQPGRAPVIVAGMVILEEVLAASGLNRLTVSESDILQGAACSIESGALRL